MPTTSGSAPGVESILAADLRADLTFLAGDGMRGRRSGSSENALAADFIASRFQRLGLLPVGDDGTFFQAFDLMRFGLGANNSLAVSLPGPEPVLGRDYYPVTFSGSASVSAGIVFAGFGISAPHLGYNDYKGPASVAGSIVLVIDHEPGERDSDSPFDGLVRSEPSTPWRKALAAQEQGAVGMLIVSDVHNHQNTDFEQTASTYWPVSSDGPPLITARPTLATWMEKIEIPVAQISPALAERIVAAGDRDLTELAATSETDSGVDTTKLAGVTVEISATVTRHLTPDRNVVAAIPGSDPDLGHEVVIICAHYDHDGEVDGLIRNGADDDGSGTVALLELGEAFTKAASAGHPPRRTILLSNWNSEEVGLLGAWAYTVRPIWPLTDTAAVLNMDMIGRNEEVPLDGGRRFRGLEPQSSESNANAINILGYSYSGDLRSNVDAANDSIALDLRFRYDNNESNLLRRSDHWPFLQRGVPALFFHTGLHPDYHRETDTPDRIEYNKMEKIVRLVYTTAWTIAQADDRPVYDLLAPR